MLSDNYTGGQKYENESILGTFSSALDFQKPRQNRFFQIHRHKYILTHTGPSGPTTPQNPRETLQTVLIQVLGHILRQMVFGPQRTFGYKFRLSQFYKRLNWPYWTSRGTQPKFDPGII